ncbi:hypothetical protein EMIT0357P_110003 [Pseudomonas marginalis]
MPSMPSAGSLCRPWTEFSDPKIHYLQLEC